MQIAVRHAHEPYDFAVEAFEYAADQTIPPFLDFNEIPRAAAVSKIDALQELQLRALSRAVVQSHALADGLFFVRFEFAVEEDLIGSGHLVTGMGQAMHEFAVIRHQQKAFRAIIQASDRVEEELELPQCGKVEDRVLAVFALAAGQTEIRLVQHPVDFGRLFILGDQTTVDGDLISLRIDLRPGFSDDLAVYPDPTLDQHLLRFPS